MLHPAIYDKRPGKIPNYIWRDGQQCFSVPAIARLRKVTPWAARKWARRRRFVEQDGHIFCALDAPLQQKGT